MPERDEKDFLLNSAEAFRALEDYLGGVEEGNDVFVDVEGENIKISFEGDKPARWVISRNSPARQVWMSAMLRSFKFAWDERATGFLEISSGEPFLECVKRLVERQLEG